MYRNPYETPTAVYDLRALTTALEVAKVEATLVGGLVDNDSQIFAVVDNAITDAEIPFFIHPVTITSQVDKSLYTVVDLRPYRNQMITGGRGGANRILVPNTGAVPFNLMRARLQQQWNKPSPPDLYNVSELPHSIFISWVGDAITRRLDLDAVTSTTVKVLAGLWYYCQFQPGTNDPSDLDERSVVKIATGINRASRIPVPTCVELLTSYGKTINTAQQFVDSLQSITSTVRFRQFNRGVFYTILAGGWRGTANQKEVVAVALEFPPTFLAMVWAAVNERTYRETPIGLLLQRLGKNGADKQFERNLGLLLNTFKE